MQPCPLNSRAWSCPVRLPRINPCSPRISWSGPATWSAAAPCASNSASAPSWSCSCTPAPASATRPRPTTCNCTPTRSGPGAAAGPGATSLWRITPAGAAGRSFPPKEHALVKAIACEVVFHTERPLSRQSLADVTDRACDALHRPISRSTVWRILDRDAIKPWQYEHWIFPRDPHFAAKAGVILDLYAGLWEDERLEAWDRIISADEKTSIQARQRCHPDLGPAPGRPRRVEPEYERRGALQYLAAWDIQEGRVMGRCEAHTGIEPFGRLVAQVMARPEYRDAPRVFWVVDNGSSHRGEAARRRLLHAYPNALLVHTPVHASWLNQVEIYFSLVQRKVLTPNNFADLAEVASRVRLYEELTNRHPRPFDWRFDRRQLGEFLRRMQANHQAQANL